MIWTVFGLWGCDSNLERALPDDPADDETTEAAGEPESEAPPGESDDKDPNTESEPPEPEEEDDEPEEEPPSDTEDDTGSPPTPVGCPPGVICLDTFPWVDQNDTTSGSRTYDAYGCSPSTNESGPEIVYELTLAEDGFLALSLSDMPAGVDVDVHLLEAADPSTCIDRGHWVAGSLLQAGVYYVVADSWVDSSGNEQSGSYTLSIGHTSAADLEMLGIDPQMADDALLAFDEAWWRLDTDRFLYSLIDFSRISTEKRLWVVDLLTEELVWHELVTHGENSSDPSDNRYSVAFSNVDGSHQSSLGVMLTAETYWGGNGYSMRYDGLEPGFNDNVRSRYIVLHPGDYATESFVQTYGYLGESWGCTVVDPDVNDDLIDDVSGGTLVLAWYPDATWRSASDYL